MSFSRLVLAWLSLFALRCSAFSRLAALLDTGRGCTQRVYLSVCSRARTPQSLNVVAGDSDKKSTCIPKALSRSSWKIGSNTHPRTPSESSASSCPWYKSRLPLRFVPFTMKGSGGKYAQGESCWWLSRSTRTTKGKSTFTPSHGEKCRDEKQDRMVRE